MSELEYSHLLSQADKYRKELEICCNDLSTCLEINSTLTIQAEQLKSQVAQLSARCQEQQQDLDFLKAQPMGRCEELELERSVHLQIIEDLKAQLVQQQRETEELKGELKRSVRDDDVRAVVQDKHTVHQDQAQDQVQVQVKVFVNPELQLYVNDFTADQGSLFDEDIEQIQVCDVKQAAMETEFETFSELMTEKESLLDEDLDKLDVCSKRQSLESEFEAYSGILEERKSHVSEELVHQRVSAKTLEIASHFEPFTELMEGEEKLLRESMEQLDFSTRTDLTETSHLQPVASRDQEDEKPAREPETALIPQVAQLANDESETPPMVADSREVELSAQPEAKADCGTSSVVLEIPEAGLRELEPVPEHEVASVSISEDISHQPSTVNPAGESEESLVLSEGSELNLLTLDSSEEALGITATVTTEITLTRPDDKESTLANGDNALANGESVIANGDSVLPNGDSVIPDGESLLPDGGSVVANGDSVVANGDSVVANLDVVLANVDAVLANADSVVANGDGVHTNGDSVHTNEDSVVTNGNVVLTNEEDHDEESKIDTETKTDGETCTSHLDDKEWIVLDGDAASTEEGPKE